MLLKTFIEWWNQNPYISFAIGLTGLLGFLLAFYYYYRGKQFKRISWSSNSTWVIYKNNPIDKLQILYDGQLVNGLVATKIVLWNTGNLTIDKPDVVEGFPLKIKIEGLVYDVEIIKESHRANNFILEKESPNIYRLKFEYLDPKEGCVLNILREEGKEKIEVSGRIKGLKAIKKVNVETQRRNPNGKLFGSKWIYQNMNLFFLIVSTILLIPVSFTTIQVIPFLFMVILALILESIKQKLPIDISQHF